MSKATRSLTLFIIYVVVPIQTMLPLNINPILSKYICASWSVWVVARIVFPVQIRFISAHNYSRATKSTPDVISSRRSISGSFSSTQATEQRRFHPPDNYFVFFFRCSSSSNSTYGSILDYFVAISE